ncbi:MAG: chemotaxis protein CheW [Pseudomonadota bacterium]
MKERAALANFDLKILCVDDEPFILELYESAVKEAGFSAILCTDPDEALKVCKNEQADILLVMSDFHMPQMTGFEFRKKLLDQGTSLPFVIVSSYVTKEMALTALSLKIAAFFDKPITEDELVKLIEKHSKPRLESIRESQALETVFLEEASNILDEMDSVLLALDHDRTSQEKLNLIFRAAHTIKGSSGVLPSDVVTRYVHKYEDIISGVKKGQLQFSDQVYEVLLKGYDRIKELIAAAANKKLGEFQLEALLPELDLTSKSKSSENEAQKPEAKSQHAPASPSLQKAKDTISVPINMLEQLSGCSGEITVIRNMVNKLVKGLELQYIGNRDIQNLGELLEEMHKINGTIQTYITDLRKVPLSGVLKPIPRIIRDLAKDLGKSIDLTIEGEKLRVDNALATVCSNSLVHLVRNSADHGIEDQATRKNLGKPDSGYIQIQCKEVGDEVQISIKDDGKGIDPKMIRNKALEKGLFTAQQLSEMNEQQTLGIIFASGFSTAAKVTDVSGRGVGMDMVRSSVEAVGGQILIDSRPGSGSTFLLKLPIPKSVLIITALLVQAGRHAFAVHQDAIERVMRIESEKYSSLVQMASLGRTLRCGEDVLPFLSLSEILNIPEAGEISTAKGASKTVLVLVLRSDNLRYALQVDEIGDAEEIVVNRIQTYFNPKAAFAGATFMGDGSVGLILNIKGIADLSNIRSEEKKQESVSQREKMSSTSATLDEATRSFLLFKLASKALFGVPLEQVFRLEEFESSRIQISGGERVIVYRDGVMPLYSIEKILNLRPSSAKNLPEKESDSKTKVSAIVAKSADGYFGLQVETVVDIASSDEPISDSIRDRKGIVGNAYIREQNVTILDLSVVLGLPLSA